MQDFNSIIEEFIQRSCDNKVRMLLVGGGAVNFHGYQRHSADIDFWIDLTPENLDNLKRTLTQMGYEFEKFPDKVIKGLQNISVKISPVLELELITKFNPGKTFEQAFADSITVCIDGNPVKKYQVLSFDDLINSKLKAGREQDFRDILMLRKIKNQ